MRKKIVAGNWKMNLSGEEARALFEVLESSAELGNGLKAGLEVVIFPGFLSVQDFAGRNKQVSVGAQNVYPQASGAYTGEVSVAQLKDAGVTHALIGHSERRAYFGEHAAFLKEKVDACLEYGITPVFCCGEPLSIRESGQEGTFVKQQLVDGLFHLSAAQLTKCVVAYEPVWAIGTGLTASSEQAESMHAGIRAWITETYDADTAEQISILYGGSCNASNAAELFSCPNVDGGLIGGASLKADSFLAIVNAM